MKRLLYVILALLSAFNLVCLAVASAQDQQRQTDSSARPQDTRSAAQASLPEPQFEVVSIKRNTTIDTAFDIGNVCSQLNAINVTPTMLLRLAYGLPESRIIGLQQWAKEERFDLIAKRNTPPSREGDAALMRGILSDRFKLIARMETRTIPVYALVRGQSDSAVNSRLKEWTDVCDTTPGAALPGQPGSRTCGLTSRPHGVNVFGMTLDQIIRQVIAPRVDRPVVNETKMAGRFSFTLEFASGLQVSAADNEKPSIFTALQEQLGLRLESRTGPAEVLVIERFDRPTPN